MLGGAFCKMGAMPRIHNFNAGPAALPAAVLERVQSEMLELPGCGASVMELSHRSAAFEAIVRSAESRLLSLLGLGSGWRVLFLQGGASLQFAQVPMNLLAAESSADYILTGDWGRKALAEAKKIGQARAAASTQEGGFRRVPRAEEIGLDGGAAYVHFTSNETIQGVQWHLEPESGGVPLVCDASSDILSRPIAAERYGLIYAGAQKNIGPSGVTIVLLREEMLAPSAALPTMLDYRTHLKAGSLYNTPPTFAIYVVDLVAQWIEGLGGLAAMQERAQEKSGLIYHEIDVSDGFYAGHAEVDSRSQMNVTFRLRDQDLEKKFLSEAASQHMMGLPGHRDVGGVRASLYNAVPIESARFLAEFMREFARLNG
jgi:phosphoserine aminotransferase